MAIVDGDAKVKAISAASILAKTVRDAQMIELHERYPDYGLDKHKGYPTPGHLAALEKHGVVEGASSHQLCAGAYVAGAR